jgi:hypothetical protein
MAKAVKKIVKNRSALRKIRPKILERKQRQGYAQKPVKRGEFSAWESDQVWND